MDIDAFLSEIERARWYRQQIAHVERVAPRAARRDTPERPLSPSLVERLKERKTWPLYLHQARAIDALGRGEHVVVATPAASGKSLCYHLPVLDALLADRSARALYIFPTKALTQDQLRSFRELSNGLGPFRADVFDGDTPTAERAAIRRGASQVVLTNPDMLHIGILPNHKGWARFFYRLRYIVVDEAHVYRGVFGAHMSALLRRLRRICQAYGATPQFILASATIGNPKDLAERLTGLQFTLVDQDGAPYGGKRFIFWNPPVVDEVKMTRHSTSAESAQLFSELVEREVRTIAFVRSRRLAELVYIYARDHLRQRRPELLRRIAAYRASYLPEQRREIEQALFRGELVGVSATNALELGIDVGDLDATVIAGYPGTISSTWQQAGRSGRRGRESLSVLVAQDNPLDQYFMRYPEAFFGRPVERALVSLENPHVLQPHLLCAAYEAPLIEQDMALFGPATPEHVAALVSLGLLTKQGARWYLDPQVSYPAEKVNIRSTSPNTYVVVEEGSGVVLETVEESHAFFQLHEGAVYLHQGETLLVKKLDRDTRTAYVTAQDVPYYTQARDVTDIRVLKPWRSKRMGPVTVTVGEVEVNTLVVGYQKRKPHTEEVLAEEFLDLPPLRFNTVAVWFGISDRLHQRLLKAKADLPGGLHAVEHAAIGVLPLLAMCDRWDIGGVSTPLHPDTGGPAVFIYDGHPGGVGIAEEGFERIEELWLMTLRAVSECPCKEGCPSCIQSPKCGNNNQPLDKLVAIEILRDLTGVRASQATRRDEEA